MMLFPNVQEIVRFRTQITAMMGLYFDESKFSTLAKVLHNRMLAHESDPVDYLDSLEARSADEIQSLARELTITETYFLRNIAQFNAYAEIALPQRLTVRDGKRKIQILSAGCASGEEPYSLAMTIRERCPHAADSVAISALDLNPAMLQKARRARYSNWSLRDMSDEMKKRWFNVDGDSYNLCESIKKAVTFESRNLTQEAVDFWVPERFDIVFCRNVLMYFSDEQARCAVSRIARSMAPGAYLFLGHAETLRGLSNDFHLCHTHDTFYYQRKQQIGLPVTSGSQQLSLEQMQPQPQKLARWQTTLLPTDTSWIDAIQRASDRIHALTITPVTEQSDRPADVLEAAVGAAEYSKASDLRGVFDSLHKENYGHSLDQLDEMPTQHARDPDVLLLKAVSLSLAGALAAAEAVCEELLMCDELNAGAHYVQALCREGVGDLAGAAEHDQTATYLDPRFAMPRLHLGLLARRQNERDSARNHLEQALLLLHQEDAARILLFGGGFKREALMALCNAELATLGAKR